MPNHYSNSITFMCNKHRLNEILEAIQYNYDGERRECGIGTINFEKILPIPASLDIESSDRTYDAARYYLTLINPCTPFLDVEKVPWDTFCELYTRLPQRVLSGLDSVDTTQLEEKWSKEFLLKRGQCVVENIWNYDAATWYDWCYENWGTKWNAYSCSYDGDNTIHFLTANGPSCKVTQALSEVYADVTMIHEWDGGYLADCCGKVQFKSGKSEAKVFSRPYELDIKVPSSLGCHKDRYGCFFSPELHGVDRNDQAAMVACVLRFAIEDAENHGTIQSGHFTDEEFARALKIALDDIEENRPRNRYGIPATSPVPKS